MTRTYYVVFMWWLLVITTIQTFHTDAKSFVNYNALRTSITRSRSAFINGKIVELDEWLQRVKSENDENDEFNSKTMYTFFKCECADYIRTATNEISELLETYAKSEDAKDFEKDVILTNLKELNAEISIAVAALLAISDNYPNLKSHEPYFLKNLLTTYLYVESKVGGKNRIDDNAQEIHRTQRIVLQITNLVYAFTIEHCGYSSIDIVNFKSSLKIALVSSDQGLQDFHQFITSVVTLDSNLYLPMDVDTFMLTDCVMTYSGDNNEGREGLPGLCHAISQKSFIRAAETDNKYKNRSICRLYGLIRHSYKVERIYEYILAVYKVVLKLIYTETRRLLLQDAEFSQEKYHVLIRKLRSRNFPTEIIDHFEFLLRVQAYKPRGAGLDAKTLNDIKIISLFYVDLKFGLFDLHLSLTEFMDLILDDVRFRLFWSVFQLLNRESETKSRRVYDLQLDTFTKGFGDFSNETRCDSLVNVYENYLIIQNKNEKSLDYIRRLYDRGFWTKHTEGSLQCAEKIFQQIRSHNNTFSNCLLQQFNERNAAIERDDDLLNILVVAIIHLKNESDTRIDVPVASSLHVHLLFADLLKTMFEKYEKLTRTADAVMNMLDHYQTRRCKKIKDRNFVYRTMYADDVLKPFDRELVAINLYLQPIARQDDGFLGSWRTSLRSAGSKIFGTARDTDRSVYDKDIPRDFYDIPRLTAKDRMGEFQQSKATEILFDWHGEKKSIREIQKDVSENALNARDFVEYQRKYVKLTFLFLLKKSLEDPQNDQNVKKHKLTDSINSQEPYEVYASGSNVIFAFYRVLNGIYGNDAPNAFKTKIVCPVSRTLKAIQVEDVEVTTAIEIKNGMTDVCSTIFSSKLQDISHMIDKNVMFFEQSLQDFQFTISNY